MAASSVLLRRGLRAAAHSAQRSAAAPPALAASSPGAAAVVQQHPGPRSNSNAVCRSSSRGVPGASPHSPAGALPPSSHHQRVGHQAIVGDRAVVRPQVAAHFQVELSTPRAATTAAFAHVEPRIRVAVDVDEVLGQFVLALNTYIEARYDMRHSVQDYFIYEFAKIWGCDQDRSHHIVHEFFKSPHFVNGIPVIPGAAQSLTRLSKSHDLLVVTSRQHVIQDATLAWLDQHFPGLFKDVYFGNHWSLEGVSRKKSDICRAVGATVLIDDNPSYAWECAQAGIHVLLYDWNHGYPWSKLKESQQHPLIQVVRDWREVEAALQRLEPELRAKTAAATFGTQQHQHAHQG